MSSDDDDLPPLMQDESDEETPFSKRATPKSSVQSDLPDLVTPPSSEDENDFDDMPGLQSESEDDEENNANVDLNEIPPLESDDSDTENVPKHTPDIPPAKDVDEPVDGAFRRDGRIYTVRERDCDTDMLREQARREREKKQEKEKRARRRKKERRNPEDDAIRLARMEANARIDSAPILEGVKPVTAFDLAVTAEEQAHFQTRCVYEHCRRGVQISATEERVELECTNACKVYYHKACWRKLIQESGIDTTNKYIPPQCLTPDCGGLITQYQVAIGVGNALRISHSTRFEIEKKKTTPAPAPTGPTRRQRREEARKRFELERERREEEVAEKDRKEQEEREQREREVKERQEREAREKTLKTTAAPTAALHTPPAPDSTTTTTNVATTAAPRIKLTKEEKAKLKRQAAKQQKKKRMREVPMPPAPAQTRPTPIAPPKPEPELPQGAEILYDEVAGGMFYAKKDILPEPIFRKAGKKKHKSDKKKRKRDLKREKIEAGRRLLETIIQQTAPPSLANIREEEEREREPEEDISYVRATRSQLVAEAQRRQQAMVLMRSVKGATMEDCLTALEIWNGDMLKAEELLIGQLHAVLPPEDFNITLLATSTPVASGNKAFVIPATATKDEKSKQETVKPTTLPLQPTSAHINFPMEPLQIPLAKPVMTPPVMFSGMVPQVPVVTQTPFIQTLPQGFVGPPHTTTVPVHTTPASPPVDEVDEMLRELLGKSS